MSKIDKTNSRKPPQPSNPIVPFRDLGDYFDSKDTNSNNDVTLRSRKKVHYQNENEARETIESLGLPFNQFMYLAATFDEKKDPSDKSYKGMDRIMFEKYVKLIAHHALPAESDATLEGHGLLVEDDNQNIKLLSDGTVTERMFFNNKLTEEEDFIMPLAPGYNLLTAPESGNTICENLTYILNEEAEKPGSSIFISHSSPLVGFIHVPNRHVETDDKARLDSTTQVIGLSIKGYFDTLNRHAAEIDDKQPYKIMITGFDDFVIPNTGEKISNFTGAFVENTGNIDAGMQSAFGRDLISKTGERIETKEGTVLRYQINNKYGRTVTLDILAKKIPVFEAYNGKEGSIQDLLSKFKPQAVISMGIDASASNHFHVTTKVDNGGLDKQNGIYQFKPGVEPTNRITNGTLMIAIEESK